jgi:hypothetical protein
MELLVSYTCAYYKVLLINLVQWHFMRKRNRIAWFLIMPLAVFFWFFGWSLYWTGAKKLQIKRKPTHTQAELTFTVIMPEQKYAT